MASKWLLGNAAGEGGWTVLTPGQKETRVRKRGLEGKEQQGSVGLLRMDTKGDMCDVRDPSMLQNTS